jgi:hypothetical protein
LFHLYLLLEQFLSCAVEEFRIYSLYYRHSIPNNLTSQQKEVPDSGHSNPALQKSLVLSWWHISKQKFKKQRG